LEDPKASSATRTRANSRASPISRIVLVSFGIQQLTHGARQLGVRLHFHELIIYQLHVGVFWAVDSAGADRRRTYGRFLDIVEKIPYLRSLGVTAIQLLPVQEYSGDFSLGYNGLDYFSPEMTFQTPCFPPEDGRSFHSPNFYQAQISSSV
jgi:1,4-alpha-glucan branching enzyme